MNIDFKDLERQIAERGKIRLLENGLALISEHVPGSGLVRGRMTLCVGAAYEAPEDHGIMHFLEHMRFGESRRYPVRDERMLLSAVIGLKIDANTAPFNITYPVSGGNDSGYMLQGNFLQGLRIVTDMVFFPSLTEESRRRELAVVQQELQSHERLIATDPFHDNSRAVEQRMYGSNPAFWKRSSFGSAASIERFTVEQLRAYHERFFVGNNTLVEIVGDLNGTANVASELEDVLREVPSGRTAEPLVVYPERPYEGREALFLPSPTPSHANVEIYFQVLPAHSPENPTMMLLSYILGNGPNSLLFRDFREMKGLDYSVKSTFDGHAKTGFLKITYSVASERLDESLGVVDASIAKLQQGAFNDALVDAFKAAHLPSLLARLQTPGWVKDELTERYHVARFGKESTYLQRLRTALNLTKQDVVKTANEALGEDRLIVVVK